MDDLRTFVETKLETIKDVDSGVPIPDNVIETGKTYFGYEMQEDYNDSDMDKNYTMTISLTGRLVRKIDDSENTLQIIDNALSELKAVLKDMNFHYSYRDITLDNNIRKIYVSANAKYNEINNKLIV